jgi:hypothetical protein
MRLMSSIEKKKYKRELLMNKRYIGYIGLAHRVRQEMWYQTGHS